jgi:hypothetical protein
LRDRYRQKQGKRPCAREEISIAALQTIITSFLKRQALAEFRRKRSNLGTVTGKAKNLTQMCCGSALVVWRREGCVPRHPGTRVCARLRSFRAVPLDCGYYQQLPCEHNLPKSTLSTDQQQFSYAEVDSAGSDPLVSTVSYANFFHSAPHGGMIRLPIDARGCTSCERTSR